MQTCTKILQVAAMNKKAVWQYRCGINMYQSHWKEHFPPLASSTSQIKLGNMISKWKLTAVLPLSMCRYELIAMCWLMNPKDRPSFSDLVVRLKDYWDNEHFYVVQSL